MAEGINTLKIVALNLAGVEGFSLHTCEIQAEQIEFGGDGGGSPSASAQFTAAPSPTLVDSVAFAVPALGIQGLFVETGPDTSSFTLTQNGVLIATLHLIEPELSSGTANTIHTLLHVHTEGQPVLAHLSLRETGPVTLEFQAEDDSDDPVMEAFFYSMGGVSFVERSEPGEFHPMLCELKGVPPELAEAIAAEFPTATSLYEGVETEADRDFIRWTIPGPEPREGVFLSGSDITKPGVIVMTQGPHTAHEAEDDPILPPDASFMHGFSKGFVNGGVSMINDGVSLLTSITNKTTQYWNLLVWEDGLWRQVKQDTGTIMGAVGSAVKIGLAVHQFMIDRHTDALGAVIDLIAGNSQTIKDLGGDYADAFAMAAEVMDYAADEWGGLPEGMKGYYMGRLTFEITSFFAGGAIAKVATKAQFVTGLITRPFFQSGRGASLVSRLTDFIQNLLTTKMCFVAGTLVLTEGGLRGIESVSSGERVWSRNEVTQVEG